MRAFLLIGLLSCGPAVAAHYALFESGRPMRGYAEAVASLRAGDSISFSNGRVFHIDRVLGQGSHTLVISVSETGRALRLSRYVGAHPLLRGVTYQDLLAGFHDSNPLLRDNGLPVVQVYPQESVPREYVAVDKLDIRFTYQEFLDGTGRASRLSPVERNQALRDFVAFARQGFRFRNVGDQLPEQIAYTPDGWKFFDYTSDSSLADRVGSATLFLSDAAMVMRGQFHFQNGDLIGVDERLPLPNEIRREVHEAIAEERRRAGLPDSLCVRIWRAIGRLLSGR